MGWPSEWDDDREEITYDQPAKADYCALWLRLARQELADAVFRTRQHQTEDGDDRGR
jgi:hypothetical protein